MVISKNWDTKKCEPKSIDTIVKWACLLHSIVIDLEGSLEIDNWLANYDTPENQLTQYQPSLDARWYNSKKAIKNQYTFKHYFESSKCVKWTLL